VELGLGCADGLGGVIGVHHRQAAVHEDQVEGLGESGLGGVTAVHGHGGRDAEPGQRLHRHLATNRAVVGDQHAAAGEARQGLVFGAGLLDLGFGKAAAHGELTQDAARSRRRKGWISTTWARPARFSSAGPGRRIRRCTRVRRSRREPRQRLGVGDDGHGRNLAVALDRGADFRLGAGQVAAHGRAGRDPGQPTAIWARRRSASRMPGRAWSAGTRSRRWIHGPGCWRPAACRPWPRSACGRCPAQAGDPVLGEACAGVAHINAQTALRRGLDREQDAAGFGDGQRIVDQGAMIWRRRTGSTSIRAGVSGST